MDMQDKDLKKAASLSYLLNSHYVKHFIRCYQLFDGDFESCVVLGEIATYNAKEVFTKLQGSNFDLDEIRSLLKGCNAYSISMSTGIPRETVRRKVKKLQDLGFIVVDEKNQLVVTQRPQIEFNAFTKETLVLFFELIEKMKDDI